MSSQNPLNTSPPGTYRLNLANGKVDGVLSSDGVFLSFKGEALSLSDMTFLTNKPPVLALRIEEVQTISLKPDPDDYEVGNLLDYLHDLVVYESESTGNYPVYIWEWCKGGDWDSEDFSSAARAEAFMYSEDQRFGYETTCVCEWGAVSEILNFAEYLPIDKQWENAKSFFEEHYSSEVMEVLDILKDVILDPYKTDD